VFASLTRSPDTFRVFAWRYGHRQSAPAERLNRNRPLRLIGCDGDFSYNSLK